MVTVVARTETTGLVAAIQGAVTQKITPEINPIPIITIIPYLKTRKLLRNLFSLFIPRFAGQSKTEILIDLKQEKGRMEYTLN